jgi:hypothetical protein
MLRPLAFVLPCSAVLVVALAAAGCHDGRPLPGGDDPIRPNGLKRDRAEIVRFMESDVMPFARQTLEPIVGAGNVRCESCHGTDAEARDWAMPAVAALPESSVRELAQSVGADPQLRNALHGYAADPEKQRIAARMRTEVLPGMARLLHRPVYDFSQPLAYNVERNAFGCYHCHKAK